MSMPELLSHLPTWAVPAAWSAITVLFSYLLGRFLTRTVCRRLSQWVSKTAWAWDDLVVDALQRGIPAWSILLGIYVAFGFWEVPEHVLAWMTRALFTVFWLSVTLVSAGLSGKLVVLYGGRIEQAMPMTSLTQNIAKILIVILGGLMVLHGLGVSITPLLTALGVGGLAVALAIQDTLSNFFSGFYLAMSQHIRVGDYVRLEAGQEGYVADIGWRATKIRMPANNMVIVPNNKLGQAIITNYYLPDRELVVSAELGVEYGSDLDRVERVTREVAREVMQTVAGGVPSWEPLVRYHTLAESSVNFVVIMKAKEFEDQGLIKHEFVKRLHARYQAEGIAMPLQNVAVHVKNADSARLADRIHT